MVSLYKSLLGGYHAASEAPQRAAQTNPVKRAADSITSAIKWPFKQWDNIRNKATAPLAEMIYSQSPVIMTNLTGRATAYFSGQKILAKSPDEITDECINKFKDYVRQPEFQEGIGRTPAAVLRVYSDLSLITTPTLVASKASSLSAKGWRLGGSISSASASAWRWVGDRVPTPLGYVTEGLAKVCDAAEYAQGGIANGLDKVSDAFESTKEYAEAVSLKGQLRKFVGAAKSVIDAKEKAAKEAIAKKGIQVGLNFVVDSTLTYFTGGFGYVLDPTKITVVSRAKQAAYACWAGSLAYSYGPIVKHTGKAIYNGYQVRNNLKTVENALAKVNMPFNPPGLNVMLLSLVDLGLLSNNENELIEELQKITLIINGDDEKRN